MRFFALGARSFRLPKAAFFGLRNSIGNRIGLSSMSRWRSGSTKKRWSFRYWFLSNLFSLRSKLIALFSLLFVAVLFLLSLVSLNHEKTFLIQEVEKRADLIADNLAMNSRDAVLSRDLLTLSSLIGNAQKDKDFVFVYIVDRNNAIIMHSDLARVSTNPELPGEAFRDGIQKKNQKIRTEIQGPSGPISIVGTVRPIQYGQISIGAVYVGLNQAGIEEMIHEAKARLFHLMGLGGIGGVVGILFISRFLLGPVAGLLKATKEVAGGNLEIWVPSKGYDELGELGASFNHMAERLREAYEGVERGYIETTRALAAAVEAKDSYTEGHCMRVTEYALEIGKRLGLSKSELKELDLAATLHDIGKIGVKDEILVKPDRLALDEMALMHLHPEIGRRILGNVEPLRKIATYILCHHEFINGKGYPHNLKGEKIPPISRIITVADSYDAMSSRRSYRAPLPEHEIRKRLLAGKGRQFDSPIVTTFMDLLDEGVIEKIRALHPEIK